MTMERKVSFLALEGRLVRLTIDPSNGMRAESKMSRGADWTSISVVDVLEYGRNLSPERLESTFPGWVSADDTPRAPDPPPTPTVRYFDLECRPALVIFWPGFGLWGALKGGEESPWQAVSPVWVLHSGDEMDRATFRETFADWSVDR